MKGQNAEWYDKVFPDAESKAKAFDKLANLYYFRNFGTQPKAEIDLLMFSEYMDRLYCLPDIQELDYSDYSISNRFGITQSRVNALKQRKETKYPSRFNWKNAFRGVLRQAEYKDEKIRIYINDGRLYTELCNEINKLGSYSEVTLTKQLIIVSPPIFVDLMMASYDDGELSQKKEKEVVLEQLQTILRENNLNTDAYLSDESITKLLKKAGSSVTENVLLGFLNMIPGVGKGLYECSKEIIDDIENYIISKKEKEKHN